MVLQPEVLAKISKRKRNSVMKSSGDNPVSAVTIKHLQILKVFQQASTHRLPNPLNPHPQQHRFRFRKLYLAVNARTLMHAQTHTPHDKHVSIVSLSLSLSLSLNIWKTKPWQARSGMATAGIAVKFDRY